ncbi:MAG: DUF6894 family protein, partial [Myxococcota bacterium]
MARFHFHLQTPAPETDDTGSEQAGLEAAKRHALKLMALTLEARPDRFWETGVCRMTVADDTGVPLYIVTVQAVLPKALA